MSCENRPALDDFVDDALPPHERQAVHDHLATCAACRAEVREIRSLVERARRLPTVSAPSAFSAIRGQLAPREPASRKWSPLPLLAAAAALVVISVSGTAWVLESRRTAAPPPVATTPDPMADLTRALQELEASLAEKPLEPEVRAVVEDNLAIIDRAITETAEALHAQPDDPHLREGLAELHRQKVAVLRRILRS